MREPPYPAGRTVAVASYARDAKRPQCYLIGVTVGTANAWGEPHVKVTRAIHPAFSADVGRTLALDPRGLVDVTHYFRP